MNALNDATFLIVAFLWTMRKNIDRAKGVVVDQCEHLPPSPLYEVWITAVGFCAQMEMTAPPTQLKGRHC